MGSHSLLQAIFPTQGSNWRLLHCRQNLYHLSHQGSLQNQKYTEPEIHPEIYSETIYLYHFNHSVCGISLWQPLQSNAVPFSILGFPDSSVGKESACNEARFLGLEDLLEKG